MWSGANWRLTILVASLRDRVGIFWICRHWETMMGISVHGSFMVWIAHCMPSGVGRICRRIMPVAGPSTVQRSSVRVLLVTIGGTRNRRSTATSRVSGLCDIMPLFSCWGVVTRLRLGVTAGGIGQSSVVIKSARVVVRRRWRRGGSVRIMVAWRGRVRRVAVRRCDRGLLLHSVRAIIICIQTRSLCLGTLILHLSGFQS